MKGLTVYKRIRFISKDLVNLNEFSECERVQWTWKDSVNMKGFSECERIQ